MKILTLLGFFALLLFGAAVCDRNATLTVYSPTENMLVKIADHLQSWDLLGGHFIPQTIDNGIIFNGIHSFLSWFYKTGKSYFNLHSIDRDNKASPLAAILTIYRRVAIARLNSRISQWGSNDPISTGDGSAPIDPAHPAFSEGQLTAITNNINNFVDGQINQLTDSYDAITRGKNLGNKVADFVIAKRANDGSTIMTSNDPACDFPIQYCPQKSTDLAHPDVPTIIYPNFDRVDTFNFDVNSVPVPAPFSYQSPEFMGDLANTRAWGGTQSNLRTQGQYTVALWYGFAGAHVSGVRVTSAIIKHENLALDLLETAEIYALISGSTLNAVIHNGVYKGKHLAPRPFQFLRYFNETAGDAEWMSILGTPLNPEYPAGHPEVTAAYTEVLRVKFDFDKFQSGPLTMINYYGQPDVSLTFNSITEIETGVISARVYGGMHLMNSCIVGSKAGLKIAEQALSNLFQVKN